MRDQDLKNLAARNVRRELQEQAFAQVPCTDSRRVELLDQGKSFLSLGMRRIAAEVADEVVKLEVQEAVIVEVINQVLGQSSDFGFAFKIPELIGQVIVERFGAAKPCSAWRRAYGRLPRSRRHG